MAYSVDTNVFIEAKNRYYRFDMPPGQWFWDLLDRAIVAGLVTSAHRMKEELEPAKDQLTTWSKAYGAEFWIVEDGPIIAAMADLANWAQARVASGHSKQSAVDEFAAGDIYLVATAFARGNTVVTHEKSNPLAKKRIMMPDACAAFGVPCIDPWLMLEDLQTSLSP